MSKEDNLPSNALYLGNTKVGDTGLTVDYGLAQQMNIAKSEARKAGGNILLVTKVIEPSYSSTCYTMSADIYYGKIERVSDDYIQTDYTKSNFLKFGKMEILIMLRVSMNLLKVIINIVVLISMY